MNNEESFSEKALRVASKYYEGEMFVGKLTFIEYLSNVVELVKEDIHSNIDEDKLIAVAYLHGVLEDTDCTKEDLKSLFPEEIVEGVVKSTYGEYQAECRSECRIESGFDDFLEWLKTNEFARIVKIARLKFIFKEEINILML
ncbi:hypothetical protein [Liquorilactobacillus hordei]|uniref:HD domain-containing protein n=1 Tax=Liquorilactobacillus hordei DSM 19519 TaxID=1423759 RepID=A0A0R1MI23_9LACO|nr:hypothetical protein [Liquorilactobacillus hordei]KRL04917.1 hypothetical protein FC92_GL001749 [Liquorilactobacillus hordei DSM 19519]QYH51643.1 hypothetical protein G6O70_03730 [Liquorilactobacillus hordei DSM 19519]